MSDLRIEDGGGFNGFAKVSNDQRLDVSARVASREYYESRDNGQVYSAISVDATAVANEETMYLKNTSTVSDMIIDDIMISSDINSQWRIKFVTGTATGTAIIPTNLNKTSSNSALATVMGNGAVGGLTDDGDIDLIRVIAGSVEDLTFNEALRLGQDDAIAVECEISCAAEIVIIYHFDSA